jgi:hypothetical protein
VLIGLYDVNANKVIVASVRATMECFNQSLKIVMEDCTASTVRAHQIISTLPNCTAVLAGTKF